MATVWGVIHNLISGQNDTSPAEVNAQVDIALSDYDGPTRAEATSDKDAIITEVDENETKIDAMIVSDYPIIKLASTTEDLNQAAASYDLFTGTDVDVVLNSLTLRNASVDCSDDATFTGISIQTDDATPAIIILQADGVKANLTSESAIAWEAGSAGIFIKVGTKIQLTIYGAASDAPCVLDIVAVYRSTGNGSGTLAA